MLLSAKYFLNCDIKSQDVDNFYLHNGYVCNKKCVKKVRKKYIPFDKQIIGTKLRVDTNIKLKNFSDLYFVPLKQEYQGDIDTNYTREQIVNKFKDMDYGALFMEMGTGKTKTILDIYKARKLKCKVIYITPKSLIRDTKKEVFKWVDDDFDIEFFSSESIGSSDNIAMSLYQYLRDFDCFLMIDESIKFKNLNAKRTKRIIKMANLAKYRFILNGTPITRSVLDLLAQMDILDKSILGMTELQFANAFLEYRLDTGERAPWRTWSKPHNEEKLMNIISPYVAYLPFKFDKKMETNNIHFNLDFFEDMIYQSYKIDVLNNKNLDFMSVSQCFQRHYTYCREKLEFLKKYNTKKTIFFVKYVFWVNELKRILKDKGSVGIYTGEQKDNNLNNFDYCVLTYGSGSFGLNLQSFSNIVFIDTTFDYGQVIQAISRIKRMGQNSDINITQLFVNTGLENIIKKSIYKKDGTKKNIETILNNMTKEQICKDL